MKLDFSHALEDRFPELAQNGKRLLSHDALGQHFPDRRQFNQRAGPAFAYGKRTRRQTRSI